MKELPPLARGTVEVGCAFKILDGITPARAGNSSRYPQGRRSQRNYPRSRGEQSIKAELKPNHGELPPLARGTGFDAEGISYQIRITPARAGNSGRPSRVHRAPWNYPRSRGEQRQPSRHCAICLELPPLARGTAVTDVTNAPGVGITPARAGNRSPN